jgi:tetratricopeptide (TPR) repeat protein
MSGDRLAIFQEAYRNLDLLPLLDQREMERFCVSYGEEVLEELQQLIEDDDTRSGKTLQDKFFGYLQWTREALRDFRFPVVLWVTYQVLNNLSRKAPDFWSWRKGVFRFASHKTPAVAARELEPFRSAGLELPSLDDDALLPLEDLKALLHQVEQQNPADPLLGTLYAQLGRIHSRRVQTGEALNYPAELAQAIQYFEKAIALQEKSEQSIDLAASLNDLAELYRSMGRYSEAEPLYQRSLAIHEAQLGADHPDTATSLNNLAGLYYSMGRYSEAEPLYRRSLAIREQQLGADHPYTASSLNNLAGLYYSMGRYGDAEPLYVQALSLLLNQLGEDHPNSQASLENFVELVEAAVAAGRAGELSDHPATQALIQQIQQGEGAVGE